MKVHIYPIRIDREQKAAGQIQVYQGNQRQMPVDQAISMMSRIHYVLKDMRQI